MPKKGSFGARNGPNSTVFRATYQNDLAGKFEHIMRKENFDSFATWVLHLFHTAKKPLGYDAILEEYEQEVVRRGQGLVQVSIMGTIAAGKPIDAIEENTETVAVPKSQLNMPGEFFALRVIGDSMEEDHIYDGDIVVIHQQTSAEVGERIVATIEDRHLSTPNATLKRYYPEGKQVRLQSSNGNYPPIYVATEKLKIGGKVVAIIPKA